MDLNADLGEGFGPWRMGDDNALLDIVTSANIACGFHAGDPSTMARVCAAAAKRNVAVGAHVSWRDLEGFGRRDIDVAPRQVGDEVVYQIGALMAVAAAAGTSVRYVKPHGALYNRCFSDTAMAEAVARAVRAVDSGLMMLAQPGSQLLACAKAAGLRTAREAFADRGYLPTGQLVARSQPGALLGEEAAVAQAVRFGASGGYESICLHGDNPDAVALARRIRSALESADIELRPFI